jgi:hypothetical protein
MGHKKHIKTASTALRGSSYQGLAMNWTAIGSSEQNAAIPKHTAVRLDHPAQRVHLEFSTAKFLDKNDL